MLKHRMYILIFFAIIVCFSCDKKNPSSPKSYTPLSGPWTGNDISFTVSDNPLVIDGISFTFSGHASGSYCSFNYKNTVTLSAEIEIIDNSFKYTSSSYGITVSFSDNRNAEITITWGLYDSYCLAFYSGSKSYAATYESTSNSSDKKTGEMHDQDATAVLTDKDSKTLVRKRYK